MSGRDRRPRLPPARATTLFARSVYKELCRAQYDPVDVVRFMTEMLDLVSENQRDAAALVREAPTLGVIDPETRLPNLRVLSDVVEFEVRRAREGAISALLLVCIEMGIPESTGDDSARALLHRMSSSLRQRLRGGDVAGRIEPGRYLVILPNATTEHARAVAARLVAPVTAQNRGDDAGLNLSGVRLEVRTAAWSHDLSAAELLEACLSAPAVPVDRVASTRDVALAAGDADGPPAVSLALGGGAARAVAHIGVLRALRRTGIRVAAVAGTSGGALIGAMYLAGMTEDEILERFLRFSGTPVYAQLRREYGRAVSGRAKGAIARHYRRTGLAHVAERRLSAVPYELYAQFIEHFVGPDEDLGRLSAPFASCATDLVEGRPTVLGYGQLHHVLRATCAVPGLFPPELDEGRVLVDGSLIAEVPVKAARQISGGHPVIAVHLARPVTRARQFTTSDQLLIRASAIVHNELVRVQLESTEELIQIPVGDVGWLEFRKAAELADAGERAAMPVLEAMAEARA